jgi:hypothetical protein
MEAILIEIRDLLKTLLETRTLPPVEEGVGESDPPPPKRTIDDTNGQCKGFTAKGHQCTNRNLLGSEYCGMHGGNKKRKVVVAAGTKAEKVIPVHTHHTNPEKPCNLCIQHGDVIIPSAPDAHYTLEERLKGMLKNEEKM